MDKYYVCVDTYYGEFQLYETHDNYYDAVIAAVVANHKKRLPAVVIHGTEIVYRVK